MLLLCVLGMNDDVSMYGIYIYAYKYQGGWTALYVASRNGHRGGRPAAAGARGRPPAAGQGKSYSTSSPLPSLPLQPLQQ